MVSLPLEFEEKMNRLLGEEFTSFREGYELPRRFGLRVNRDKLSPEEFQRIAPFTLTPIPWVDNGFYYGEEDRPSRHPFYYGGLYYLQEPSAMTPANILPVRPGDRVLDLCAAPGGKTTELGAKLHGRGFLAANDISGPRARALLKNVEVFGIPNSLILNEVPAKLSEVFPEFFDKVLVDAPCSGEGMFRKDPDTARAWKPEKPVECAKIQREIILRAADMLVPGGIMMYSTCTFSPEENEQMIAFLLKERPDFHVLPINPRYEGFAPGRPDLLAKEWLPSELWTADEFDSLTEEQRASLADCVRIWPHRMGGEGHFLALLGRDGVGRTGESLEAFSTDTLSETSGKNNHVCTSLESLHRESCPDMAPEKSNKGKRRSTLWEAQSQDGNGKNSRVEGSFQSRRNSSRAAQVSSKARQSRNELAPFLEFAENLDTDWELSRVEVRKGQVYYVPAESSAVRGLIFLRNGLYLGEIKKDRFEPSQALAAALKKSEYRDTIDLTPDDPRVLRYLKGETIEISPGESRTQKGWQLLCVSGYPLGWGKLVNGLLKNKFLASWRM